MPKRITIQPHLSLEELERRYRQANDRTERSHYQLIWLLAQGKPTEEVAALTGYSRSWIYELVWGYNRLGPDTLGDKRHNNVGASPSSMTANKHNCGKHCKHHPPMVGYGQVRKSLPGSASC